MCVQFTFKVVRPNWANPPTPQFSRARVLDNPSLRKRESLNNRASGDSIVGHLEPLKTRVFHSSSL